MSYTTLAAELKSLSVLLEKNADKLSGAALAKAATSLAKTSASFSKKLKETLGGQGPGIAEFTVQLNGSLAKKVIKGPALAKLYKKILNKNLSSDLTTAQGKKLLFSAVVENELGEKALAELKTLLAELTSVEPPPKDKESLQREFLALGRLDDEDAQLTLVTRFKAAAALKALAQSNNIIVKPKTKRETIEREIIHYARRAAANVRS
jgi:hypothetical protein